MADRTDAPPVVDEPDSGRFAIHYEDGDAELEYRIRAGRMLLTHTGVPDVLQGRGVASRLVRTAVERAAQEGLTVVPWCPYARKWLEDHADAAATVDIDWTPPPQS